LRAVVADASALIEYLLRTPRAPLLAAIVEAPGVSLHVPALCDVEVAAVLRRALLTKRLDEGRAREALIDYFDLPITRHGHAALVARILQLRDNFSAYDATYAALAETLGASFVTADDALARAARTHLSIAVHAAP
jgi:predicted nucleic acid-binding protein